MEVKKKIIKKKLGWGGNTLRQHYYSVVAFTTDKLILEGLKVNIKNLNDYLNSLTLKEINQLINTLEKEYKEAMDLVFDEEDQVFSINLTASSLDESMKMDLDSYILSKMPWIYLYGELSYFEGYDAADYEKAVRKHILENRVLK